MLQTEGEVGGRGAGSKIAVGIVAGRQRDQACGETGASELTGEAVRSPLAGLIVIVVEGQVDTTTRLITQLSQLQRC
jgi:hypothetical protein